MARDARYDVSKTEKFWFTILGILIVFALGFGAGYSYFGHPAQPPTSPVPVAPVVKAKPVTVPEVGHVVAMSNFDNVFGQRLVEIDTKSGYKCFVIHYSNTNSAASINCHPAPVK